MSDFGFIPEFDGVAYDRWKTTEPVEHYDEPEEYEPDWDDIRESRAEIREDRDFQDVPNGD